MRRSVPLLAVAGLLLAPAPALACGGLFCQNLPVDQAGEKILFVADGTNVTAHVQIQYQGPAQEFSWVVPVPTAPKLAVGSDRLFRALEGATRPEFTLDYETEGRCGEPSPGAYYPNMPQASAPAPSGGSVSVSFRGEVGPYDAAVIRSNDPGALKAWLRENRYVLPPGLDPLLDPYVAGKYHFIALKLLKDREAGDVQPIVFSYAATKPGVPLRLTGVAATPDMGVYVWVLGMHRAVPENYRHAAINEARIDWLGNGQNYPQVVTDAMNEAGGQAFVTDFAGKAAPELLAALEPGHRDPQELAQERTPATFVRALSDGRYFGQPGDRDEGALLAYLRRHVPKPASLAGRPDREYYNGLLFGDFGKETDGIRIDTQSAIVDLERTVLAPQAELREHFAEFPVLTRLYTTLSPEEMTQDPVFVLNPDLPAVDRVHHARAVQRCSKDVFWWDAPIHVSLADGTTFVAARRGANGASPRPLQLPAAARVEQLQAAGGAALIRDNARAIRIALADAGALVGPVDPPGTGPSPAAASPPAAPAGAIAIDPASGQAVAVPPAAAGGFGCAGCANPAKAAGGTGEGAAFALFALSLAGWRWRARRR